MYAVKNIGNALLGFVYPHVCSGCGTDVLQAEYELCAHCIASLPYTGFEQHALNPVEKIFRGRLPLQQATSFLYFTKDHFVQQIMHRFKYRGYRQLGTHLGHLMAWQLQKQPHFQSLEAVVPVPMLPEKQFKRGYNQAVVLSEAIAEILGLPVINNCLIRCKGIESQTKKTRLERQEHMSENFKLHYPQIIAHKHVLLVDDIITTGATMESCGRQLLNAPGSMLSIASLCYTWF